MLMRNPELYLCYSCKNGIQNAVSFLKMCTVMIVTTLFKSCSSLTMGIANGVGQARAQNIKFWKLDIGSLQIDLS